MNKTRLTEATYLENVKPESKNTPKLRTTSVGHDLLPSISTGKPPDNKARCDGKSILNPSSFEHHNSTTVTE